MDLDDQNHILKIFKQCEFIKIIKFNEHQTKKYIKCCKNIKNFKEIVSEFICENEIHFRLRHQHTTSADINNLDIAHTINLSNFNENKQ
jgi:hypothetical protein